MNDFDHADGCQGASSTLIAAQMLAARTVTMQPAAFKDSLELALDVAELDAAEARAGDCPACWRAVARNMTGQAASALVDQYGGRAAVQLTRDRATDVLVEVIRTAPADGGSVRNAECCQAKHAG